jgi:hypothetical protein
VALGELGVRPLRLPVGHLQRAEQLVLDGADARQLISAITGIIAWPCPCEAVPARRSVRQTPPRDLRLACL